MFSAKLPTPIVQVHLDGITYDKDDRIACFLPSLESLDCGCIMTRRFLIFNPQEPHSLSLQCHKGNNDVYLISSYLKTQVVGLNNNSNMVI